MAREPTLGTCAICLEHGKLSFEHVPPKSAFNNRAIRAWYGEAILDARNGAKKGYRIQQRGSGGMTLCGPCNRFCGKHYVPAFLQLVTAAVPIVEAGHRSGLVYLEDVHALAVGKQILAMFCSVQGPSLVEHTPWIGKLLLDTAAAGLPEGLRIFLGFTPDGGVARQSGFSSLINLRGGSSRVFAELAFRPFVYVLCAESEPPDPRLVDVTWLLFERWGERRRIPLDLSILSIASHLPGDYRRADELAAAVHENNQRMAERAAREALKERGK
jgi:hypothetical protein